MLTSLVEFFTGHPAVPWGELTNDPHKLIESRCIPPTQILDPSQLKRTQLVQIYEFWFQRQHTSTKPLRFIKDKCPTTQAAQRRLEGKAMSRKGKQREYVEISDVDADGEEEEIQRREPVYDSPAATPNNKIEDYLKSLCDDIVFLACITRSAKLKVSKVCSW
jgi:hypothetical protein